MLDYRFQPRQKYQKKGDKNNNKYTINNRQKGRQFKYETRTGKHKEMNQGKI